MKISYNEILTLSQKAFEGAGCGPGQYQDAAEMISWLALHGLGAWTSIYDDLRIGFFNANPSEIPIPQLYEDDTVIMLDSRQSSSLFSGPSATDFAYLAAMEKGDGAVSLKNCQHPMLLLAFLSRYAQRGMHSLTQWQEQDHTRSVVFVADQPLPTIYRANSERLDKNDNVSGELYTDVMIRFSSRSPFSAPSDAEIHYSPTQLQEQRTEHLEQGIEIDERLWAQLQHLAKRVLVEATEESRQRGAGEGSEI